jgi:hypothetical protein
MVQDIIFHLDYCNSLLSTLLILLWFIFDKAVQ